MVRPSPSPSRASTVQPSLSSGVVLASSAERVARLRRLRRELGLVELHVWVPAAAVDRVKALVSELVEEAKTSSPPSGNTGGIDPLAQPDFFEEDQ